MKKSILKNILAPSFIIILSLFVFGCGKKTTPDTVVTPTVIPTVTPAPTNTASPTATPAPLPVTETREADIFAINDLHGKLKDSNTQPGVDELTTYLQVQQMISDGFLVLSSGDMWQGSSESNQTKGAIITEWMNEVGFASMTLGNHEFDWGTSVAKANSEKADFPFLAINIFDKDTKKRVDWCDSSVLVEQNGITFGIIGAIGDCYDSISGDKVKDIYFVTGSELTALVKQEATNLRALGADFIIYSIHDGYGRNSSGVEHIDSSALSPYYDIELSKGYIDLSFEAHTHRSYVMTDRYGVYHIQTGAENSTGIAHVHVAPDESGKLTVTEAEHIVRSTIISNPPSKLVENLLDKYADQIGDLTKAIGHNDKRMDSDDLRQLCADLYFDLAMEHWGDKYDIALAGGFFSCRTPYYLPAGDVTYEQLQSLFPFDNEIVLCSTTGIHLNNNFFATRNDNYFITYGDYGQSVLDNLNPNGTYYLVTDTYTSQYAPNNLTVVEEYDKTTFARDLLAEYYRNN